jgi:hypothetical protein
LLQDQALGGAKIKNDREQKWLWPQLGPNGPYGLMKPAAGRGR